MKVPALAVLALLALFFVARSPMAPVKGYYKGSLESESSQEVSIFFSTTGDGITVGDWQSLSPLKKGVLTSNTDFLGRITYSLNVSQGSCLGEFPVEIRVEASQIAVHVDTSQSCAVKSYTFRLNESEKPTDQNLLIHPPQDSLVLRIAAN